MTGPIISAAVPRPGANGLNTQSASAHLGPQWATKANNAVIDDAGRLAARKGWDDGDNDALAGTPTIEQIHNYIDGSGTETLICAANSKLYKTRDVGAGSGVTNDITGVLTPTNNNWQFANFNGDVVGWQDGESPIIWTGTGNFAAITFKALSGGSHTWGNVVHAAYGRLWTFDSTHTIVKYSALLDETEFTSDDGQAVSSGATDAGIIDLKSVWVYGMDKGVAICSFNGTIIFFAEDSILIYADSGDLTNGRAGGSFPTYGTLDPNSNGFQLVENIRGIGCIARDSIQQVGNDILFLSNKGIVSLSRVIQEKSLPIYDESKNVTDYLMDIIAAETRTQIRSAYCQLEGFYLLTCPTTNVHFCLDIRGRLEDGSRRITTWDMTIPGGLCVDLSQTLYFGMAGVVGDYQGYQDNGSDYTYEWLSGWFPVSEAGDRVHMLKNIISTVKNLAATSYTAEWGFDYTESNQTYSVTLEAAEAAEWGAGEWGVDIWGSGSGLQKFRVPGSNSGKVFRFGGSLSISGYHSQQETQFNFKQGRIE